MYNYLCKIENHLGRYISTSIASSLIRTVSDECIILSNRTRCNLSVHLFCDSICVNFAGECKVFDITDRSTFSSALEAAGSFVNELMTGALIYERTYFGNTQIKYSVFLINRITKRKLHLGDNILTSQYPKNAPRLVLREKLYFY